MLRQPILVFMGNVDAGKTQLLDTIRNTAMVSKESGGITQAIGASIIPTDSIKKICGDMLPKTLAVDIPGILTIDTPGHAAFTNLRKRGGNLADIAVLVIDIRDGVKPQTIECIDILKQYKIPFVVALNKIDMLTGWKSKEGSVLQTINEQSQQVITEIETKLYEVVAKLNEFEFNADRYDRVSDYTAQIAIVPTSAVTKEGIPELLLVLIGLCQKYLEKNLEVHPQEPAKGTILEVKEEKGLGKTIDAVIYDGRLRQNDTIVIGSMGEPIVTRVKALLEPAVLCEMRDKKSKFKTVKEVTAAIGVKICAPDSEEVVAGMPLRSAAEGDVKQISEEVKQEVQEVVLETDDEGIIVKADSLGSLEAVVKLFREHEIPIKKASIGTITKKDIADAECNVEKDPLFCAIVGFNVDHVSTDKVKVITGDIIYSLIDVFKEWQEEQRKKIHLRELEHLAKPCRIKLLKGYVFRQNNPAVVGCEVLDGTLKAGVQLMKKDGRPITEAKSMQLNKENVSTAEKGQQLAVSFPDVTVGRQIHEEDILYSFIPEDHFKKLKEYKKELSPADKELLKEIAKMMRERNPVWGV